MRFAEAMREVWPHQLQMNNGAIVLRYKSMMAEGYWVVLCSFNNQFVVWKADKEGNGYWGNYFSTFDAANDNFEGRR